MTGKERIETTLNMKEPDRVPVLPMAHFYTAQFSGISIPLFATDGDKMGESLIKGREKFGWDGISVACDVALESSALGSKMNYTEDGPPSLAEFILADDPGKLKSLKIPNPLKDGRMPALVRATELCVKEAGDEFFIMTHHNDAMNQAGMIRGVGNFMMDIYDRPEFVDELLNFSNNMNLELGKALIDVGVHAIFLGAALCSPNIISPVFYREKVLPHQQKLVKELRDYGAKYVLVHICGDITNIIPDILETNCDIIDIDWQVAMGQAKNIVDGKATIRGNINPALLVEATPENIYQESVTIIKDAGSGGGLILAAGCDVMTNTPPENIKAMVQASIDTPLN